MDRSSRARHVSGAAVVTVAPDALTYCNCHGSHAVLPRIGTFAHTEPADATRQHQNGTNEAAVITCENSFSTIH